MCALLLQMNCAHKQFQIICTLTYVHTQPLSTPNLYSSSFKLSQQILRRSNALLVLSVFSRSCTCSFSNQYLLIERDTLFFPVMSIIRLRNLEIRFARLFIFFILLWIKCRLEFYCLNNFHDLIIFTPEVFYMYMYM